MPYDDSLVRLRGVPFINASMVRFQDNQQQFIATMAPTPNTIHNFWKMVIEKRVDIKISALLSL